MKTMYAFCIESYPDGPMPGDLVAIANMKGERALVQDGKDNLFTLVNTKDLIFLPLGELSLYDKIVSVTNFAFENEWSRLELEAFLLLITPGYSELEMAEALILLRNNMY